MAVNVAFSCTWYMSISWICLNVIKLLVPDMHLYMTHKTQSMMLNLFVVLILQILYFVKFSL